MEVTHTPHLNLEKLTAAKLETSPYEYVIVPGFLSADTVRQINATYPKIEKGGSYPVESLDSNMTIKEVIAELDGPAFEAAIEDKFHVELEGRPKMYSLRGYTRAKDGQNLPACGSPDGALGPGRQRSHGGRATGAHGCTTRRVAERVEGVSRLRRRD